MFSNSFFGASIGDLTAQVVGFLDNPFVVAALVAVLALVFAPNIALTLRRIPQWWEDPERRMFKQYRANEKQYRKNRRGQINRHDAAALTEYGHRSQHDTRRDHDLIF